MAKVNFEINEGKKTISFEIAGIKQDIGFASTDHLSKHHLANEIIHGAHDGEVYFNHDSETFKSLSLKYDEELLNFVVGALLLPTYSYKKGRVLLQQQSFFDFMDKVISAYAKSMKPREVKKFFSYFMSAKRKKRQEQAQKKYERTLNTKTVDIAYSLQYHGIVSHNPYGNFDGLVINTWELWSYSQPSAGFFQTLNYFNSVICL